MSVKGKSILYYRKNQLVRDIRTVLQDYHTAPPYGRAFHHKEGTYTDPTLVRLCVEVILSDLITELIE